LIRGYASAWETRGSVPTSRKMERVEALLGQTRRTGCSMTPAVVFRFAESRFAIVTSGSPAATVRMMRQRKATCRGVPCAAVTTGARDFAVAHPRGPAREELDSQARPVHMAHECCAAGGAARRSRRAGYGRIVPRRRSHWAQYARALPICAKRPVASGQVDRTREEPEPSTDSHQAASAMRLLRSATHGEPDARASHRG
jgi:hypothetical protein